MATSENSAQMITAEFRLSMPHLFEPRAFVGKKGTAPKPDAKKSFDCQGIFEQAGIAQFQMDVDGVLEFVDANTVCQRLASAEWPGVDLAVAFTTKSAVAGIPDKVTWPIRNGDKLAAELEMKAKAEGKKPYDNKHILGKSVINMKSSEQIAPRFYVVENGAFKVLDRGVPSDMTKAKSLFAAGNYCKAEVTVKPSLVDGRYFMTFYINGIIFSRKGEPLGQKSLMQKFDGIIGAATAHDPTKGLPEDIAAKLGNL